MVSNGNNIIWDNVFEKTVLDKVDKYEIENLVKKIDNYLQTNYTDTVQVKPVITYLHSFSPTFKQNLKSFNNSPKKLKLNPKFNTTFYNKNMDDKDNKNMEEINNKNNNLSQKLTSINSEEVEDLIEIFDDKVKIINKVLK